MKLYCIFSFFILFGTCVIEAQETDSLKRRPRRIHNPKEPMVHDPVLAKENGTYYLFSTGMGINVFSSKDMIHWDKEKPVFENGPQWAVDLIPGFRGHIWAPDIIYYKNKYHLFYSCSAFGKNTSAIGVATNPTLDKNNPAFKWTDHGKVLQSVPERDLWNAIDANIIIDENGTAWMNFGSFWDGIKIVRLADDMLSVAQPEEWHTLSRYNRTYASENNPVEAPFIMKHDNFYYLFVSFDYCCKGVESTYKIAVGRSESVTGPYIDKEGEPMDKGGGTIIAEGDGYKWAGIGHCAAYNFDGQDYLVAHAYSISDNGSSKLVIRKIKWDDEGWPSIEL